jgi:outer membrane protein assembly factor BamB
MVTSIVLSISCVAAGAESQPVPSEAERPMPGIAATILEREENETGLCVHIGCGDASSTAALAHRRNWLVQGVAFDDQEVLRARKTLRHERVHGRASADRASLSPLPYADNLVNVVLVDDLPRAIEAGLTPQEILRVLCPEGVAYLGQAAIESGLQRLPMTEHRLRAYLADCGVSQVEIVKKQGIWARIRKPRPAAMDDWTHRSYDAGGNCVSRDAAIGPLTALRWIAGPAWPMGTYYQVGNGAVLSAGGRVFHVTLNETSNRQRTPQQRNHQWFLVARDAHNGLLQWSRPIGRKMLRDGQEFGDLFVAGRDHLYIVLGDDLVALDPATGATRRVILGNVRSPSKMALLGGKLFLAGKDSVCAIDTASAELLWEHSAGAADLVVSEDGIYLATAGHKELRCLDWAKGKPRWTATLDSFEGRKKQLLFAKGGIVVFAWERDWQIGHNGIAAFDAAGGELLWRFEYRSSRATWPNTVWLVDDLVWHRRGESALEGVGPRTGKVERRVVVQGSYSGGCVRNVATERFLIGTRPLNFVDWQEGRVAPFRGGRHGCRAGVIVANGLLYSQPHGCKCVRESLRGFVAFSPRDRTESPPQPRLELGEAFSQNVSEKESPPENAWPTYRHDPARTGGTRVAVPSDLKLLWQSAVVEQPLPEGCLADEWQAHPLGADPLTAPTIANGLVYVALKDAHQVVALDAATGQHRWDFTTGGRLDTPPTVYRGRCFLGCYDGWVYCLRAADGKRLYRLRAAPRDRRVIAFGQVESSWPVVGGVLVAAVDGGIHGCAFDPTTGRIHWSKTLAAALTDVLIGDDRSVRMAGGGSAGVGFDPATGEPGRDRPSPGFDWTYSGKLQGFWGGPNRVLDRTWHVLSVNDTASHWMRIKQGYGPHTGQLVVASPDESRAYGFRFKYVHWSKVKDPETEFGGELVAWQGDKELWKRDVPATFQVEAMVLAGDVLFAGGPVDRFRRVSGGELWAINPKDGRVVRTYSLEAPPVADGIAAASGRLYVAAHDGRLACYGRE